MPRPHGQPRWAFLALACAALLAVAMIPRGVVRTIEASHLPDVPVTEHERFERPAEQHTELPGVRAVVSREERDLVPLPVPPGAVTPGDPAVHEATHDEAVPEDDGPPVASPHVPEPSGPRAPPPSI